MSIFDPVVERRLTQAAERWRLLKFMQAGATLGTAVLAVVLAIGAANAFAGLPAVFVILGLVVGGGVGFVGCFLLAVVLLTKRYERTELARAWERAHAPLLDRLNTLVYLEGAREMPWAESYARRIAAQAHGVLAKRVLPQPFPSARPLAHVLVFVLALAATVTFYRRYEPWRVPYEPPPPPLAAPEPALEMPPPRAVEEEAVWGEVRITAPGADLAVTPAEVVPVQIEAASNRPLESVTWFTSVNDGAEQAHALPAPEEPLFAAYRPTLVPSALGLHDWDIVTYHAEAKTKTGATYKSDVYFIEIRPFLDDLLAATGGDEGLPYELFDELTGLIEQQQDVIRRTHRGQTAGDDRAALPVQERTELARTEDGLARATDHLAAKFDAALRWRGLRGPEEKLSEAAGALDKAAARLRDDDLDGAKGREREALAKLVAARQKFQTVLAQRPDAFRASKDEKTTQQPDPAAMLKQVAEFRDEAAAAEDFVSKTRDEQRKLARPAAAKKSLADRARQQEALAKSLDEFRKQHPSPFEDSEKPFNEARRAMEAAADALKRGGAQTATPQANEAAAKLDELAKAMKRPAHDRQLADAYRLKQELDAQIKRFRNVEKTPGAFGPDELKTETDRTQALADQLRQVAEKPPTRDDFRPDLRKALDEKALSDLKARCEGLCQGQGQGPGAKAGAAKGVREGLEAIARAFEKSAPRTAAAEGKAPEPLKPTGQRALDRGLAQLEALAGGEDGSDAKDGASEKDGGGSKPGGNEGSLGQRGGRSAPEAKDGEPGGHGSEGQTGPGRTGSGKGPVRLAPSQEKKLRAEAAANLTAGVRGKFGDNERSLALVKMIEREVRGRPEPIDAAVIGRLRQALEERQIEVSAAGDSSEPAKPKATHLDPARVPPAYRKAIETYFEKLSERP